MIRTWVFLLLPLVQACNSERVDGPQAADILGGKPITEEIAKVTVFYQTEVGYCTGVLISSHQVLTAAHCINRYLDDPSVVRGRQLDFYFKKISSPQGRASYSVKVAKVDVNPTWIAALRRTIGPGEPGGLAGSAAADETSSDIAVIHLEERLSDAAAEVDVNPVSARSLVRVAGGGCTESDFSPFGELLQVTLPVTIVKATRYELQRTNARGQTVGTCPGDSGGPVFRVAEGGQIGVSTSGRPLVVAVTSASSSLINVSARLANPELLSWLRVSLAGVPVPNREADLLASER